MTHRCFKCERPLFNPQSVQRGIGPICHAKQEREMDAEAAQRQRNLTCHNGLVCFNPEHAGTTMQRFLSRFNTIQKNAGLPADLVERVCRLTTEFADVFGLDRENLPVPEINVPMFGAESIEKLKLPKRRDIRGGRACDVVSMPFDHDEQYRRVALREMRICPFGLDCRDPKRGVAVVWELLSILRYQMEPRLLTETGIDWSWDQRLYEGLAGTLDVLGLYDDAEDVRDTVSEQRSKPQRLRFADADLTAGGY